MYRVYGIGSGYQEVEDLNRAHAVMRTYEFFDNAPYLTDDGLRVISDGSQAQRVIADAAKFWKAAEVKTLEWWISVYKARGGQRFAPDLALIEKRLAEIVTPKS